MTSTARRARRLPGAPATWLPVGLVALATACAPGGDRRGDAAVVASGIVLITVDGLVAAETSAFGGSHATPNLSALVEGGVAWPNAWTACPQTRPAATTYLTGRVPGDHGVWNDLYASLRPGDETLPVLLAAAGFRTAAFPDNGWLGRSSGLLEGFEVVDEPPPAGLSVRRYIPVLVDPPEQAAHFEGWLEGLREGERFFAWIHSSQPYLERFAPVAGSSRYEAFDAWLGRVVDATGARGGTVLLAGTFGESFGGGPAPPGPGMTLTAPLVEVPVVLAFPGDAPTRGPDALVWAPDVSVTIARLGGVALSGSPGLDLFTTPPVERAVFAWSRAPREQFGWTVLAAARSAGATVNLGEPVPPLPGGAVEQQRLIAELAIRPVPDPVISTREVGPVLVEAGRTLSPVPGTGRPVEDGSRRRAAARAIWEARAAVAREAWGEAVQAYGSAARTDPGNLAALLDGGQIQAALGRLAEGNAALGRAVDLYPGDVEALHWYAHSIWEARPDSAARLLAAILPERPADPDLLYDMACARSLAGDLAESEDYLRSAVAAGYREWEHMQVDPDLRNLRESGAFAELMREHRR